MAANKTLWSVVLILWMLGSTWWHVCKIKQLCPDDKDPAEAKTVTAVRMPSLLIADSTQFRLNLLGNFSFAGSGANANMNTLLGPLDSLTAYLKTSGRHLNITGYYTDGERNPTTFPNLGLARAEAIRQFLIQQGIPAGQLATTGELKNNLTFTPARDSLYGGIAFTFSGPAGAAPVPVTQDTIDTAANPVSIPDTVDLPDTEQGLADAQKFTSVFEPIDLYFPLSEADYIKTKDTQQFFHEAARYLNTHKDKKLIVTGYTDDRGPTESNLQLSRERANGVKKRLRQSGINADQVVVEAKGEADPKASNETRAGRKANRRVTVVVR